MADGLDVSRLSPMDAVAALRSYPRRFRAVLTPLDDEDAVRVDDIVHRAGADGRSAVDHADHAGRSMAILGEALRQVLQQDEPTLLPAVVDDAARVWQMAATPVAVDAALDFLTVECGALADAIDRTSGDAWSRVGVVAGTGQRLTALDVAREAVRTGADHLRAAERAVETGKRS